jgi:hypothetical protein
MQVENALFCRRCLLRDTRVAALVAAFVAKPAQLDRQKKTNRTLEEP